MTTFLVSLVSGLLAAILFELLHHPEDARRGGGTRLSGRLFVSDHNRPRHRAALLTMAGIRWSLVAIGAGLAGLYGLALMVLLGANGAELPASAMTGLAIITALFIANATRSQAHIVRGLAAIIIGLGLAALIIGLTGDAMVTALMVTGLSVALIWRALGLVPPLR
ncbi:MAG: hypothetical protein ACQRW7_11275 [Caulobacterales bacterium]|uniref:hypothetical protein n=1 Tax=Glycocaulis sp. TaxID=1969725 RepID=UPI003F9F6DA9